MSFDIVIVAGFLILTLVVGLGHGQKIKNISQYAVGNRNFATITISATIIATWISGGIFSIAISETYSNGLYFMFGSIGLGAIFLIMSFVLIPRMGEFLGKTSIAEAMGATRSRLIKVYI